jgi:hypothetical protein
MSGEVVVQAAAEAALALEGSAIEARWEPATGTFAIPFTPGKPRQIDVATKEA